LQNKYNIGLLMVNIEFTWLGTKLMERLIKTSLFPISKPSHINFIFTVNTSILYIYILVVVRDIYNVYIYIINQPHRWCNGELAVDRGFEPQSGQTNNYKIGIWCVSDTHAAVWRKSKDWLNQDQNNVPEWNDLQTVITVS
jgi:hypothetical protein